MSYMLEYLRSNVHRRTRRGSRGGGGSAAPPVLKYFRASASCSKILNDDNISIQWKISGQLVFFRASASCSRILNDKKYIFDTVNSGHTLFYRARASCSNILNVKVYSIQWKFSGQTLCFRASASSSKILNGKKYIQCSGKFHVKLCFPGQGEKNFNTVYYASKGNYRKVSCLGEHNTQETSPPWVNKQGDYRVCR